MEENRKKSSYEELEENASWNQDGRIEDLLRDVSNSADMPVWDSKELDRMINRRIAAMVTKVLVILAVSVALLLCIIHPVTKLTTYNYKAKAKVENPSLPSEMVSYLHAYTSVFMPWLEVYDAEVEERGFGRYELNLYTTDHRERFITPRDYEDLDTYQIRGHRWERTEEADQRFVHEIGRYYIGKEPSEIMPQLMELPESAEIYCMVSLPESVLPEELWQEGIDILWIRVDQRINQIDAGLRIAQRVYWTDEIYDRSAMTGAQLKNEFLKELEVLVEDKEFLEILGVPYSSRGEDGRVNASGGGCKNDAGGVAMVVDLYEAASTWDAIRTREICLSGKKADVLDYIERMNVQDIYVENVKMSQWSK